MGWVKRGKEKKLGGKKTQMESLDNFFSVLGALKQSTRKVAGEPWEHMLKAYPD